MNDSDAALLARLRSAAEEIDPVPGDLADRMIAAIAVADLSREYALLTLVEDGLAAVRSDAETATLQFSNGSSGILLHISRTATGRRRIDGWLDAEATSIRLVQGDRERRAAPDGQGRFVFDDVPPGLSRVEVITAGDGENLITPQFEA